MGLLDTVTGFFTTNADTVNTGARIAEKSTDGLIAGIDKLFHTSEEKSEDKIKMMESVRGYWDTFANENSEQSKARRTIAQRLVLLYIGVVLVGIVMILFDMTSQISTMLELLGAMKFGWAFIAIVSTYFVPHQVSKVWKSKNVKK